MKNFTKMIHQRALQLFLLIPLLMWGRVVNSLGYLMEDLEILAQEKNYREFFAHAPDIRPRERTDRWRQIVTNMAEHYIKELLQREQIDGLHLRSVEEIAEWPVLQENEFFIAERFRFGLKFFSACLKGQLNFSETECLSFQRKYWNADKMPPEIAFQFATQILQLRANSQDMSWSYWQRVISSQEVGEFYCPRKETVNAINYFLLKTWQETAEEKEFLQRTTRQLSETCLKSLSEQWKKELFNLATNTTEERLTHFFLLQKFNFLDEQELSHFYISYFLESPTPGPLFNKSWNSVTTLRMNPEKRHKAVAFFQTLDLLPGKIFQTPNKQKRRVLLELLAENFPEYLDLYANTCLDYRMGRKTFPRGNPTLSCDELFHFAAENKKNLLTPAQQQEYAKNTL